MVGIDQVGLVVHDIDKTIEMFQNVLGISNFKKVDWPIDGKDPKSFFRGKQAHWRMRLAFAQIGPLQIELIQPVDENNQFSEFIKKHGPGLHHLRVLVEDIDKNIKRLKEEGVEILSTGTGVHKDSRWAYFDTSKLLGGLILELRTVLKDKNN